MPLRIVIVGPGRVGSAFGHRLARRGACVLGFVGRDEARTAAAVRFCGAGAALQWSDLGRAHVVVFAVGDGDLGAAIAAAARAVAPRSCSLWLHTSGRHGLDVFDATRVSGVRRGSIHPVAPFADPSSGLRAMHGAPAVLDGDGNSQRLLHRLCDLLGMVPVVSNGGERATYHAACALAANGTTALHALVERVFAASGCLRVEDQRRLTHALMASALQSSSELGAALALSGPVRRGDKDTLSAHLASLGRLAPEVLPAYRALMLHAVDLAAASGLDAIVAGALRSTLAVKGPS